MRAIVLSIDKETEKFSLGIKQLERDPWENIKARYKIGQGIEGKVMPSEALASGFIYFPGEAETAKELRLQVRFRNTGRLQTLNLKFK